MQFRKRISISNICMSALALAILFNGCTETVDMKNYVSSQDATPILVVDGEINTDTMAHKVTLIKSGNVSDSQPIQVVSGALVTISDGTQLFMLKEDTLHLGTYLTDSTVYGVPGRTYTLDISNVDVNGDGVKEEYTASSYLPKINPIDSIQIQYIVQNKNFRGWLVDLYGQEIGGGRNFYLPKFYINQHLVTDSIHKYQPADNTGFNGTYFNGFPVGFLNQNITEEIVKPGDLVTLELDGITEGYYNYIEAFLMQYGPKIPIFSGPSANVPTNISPESMATGFFAAYSIERKSRIYTGQ